MDTNKIKLINSTTVYKGDWLTLRKDEIIRPNGQKGTYEIVERKDAVMIVPKLDDKFILINVYRYPVKDYSLEFPQGFMAENETPEQSGRRELQEEINYDTEKLTFLGTVWSWPGLLTQKLHIFLGEELKQSYLPPDELETIKTIETISYEEIIKLIKEGKIRNTATIAAIQFYSQLTL